MFGQRPWPSILGKPRKVDSPQKKKLEKPQDGRQKSSQNIGNPYQMEDDKAAPSAPPPWGSCCLPFGKDFLCLGLISGAHAEAFPPSLFWDCPPSLALPCLSVFCALFVLQSLACRRLVGGFCWLDFVVKCAGFLKNEVGMPEPFSANPISNLVFNRCFVSCPP